MADSPDDDFRYRFGERVRDLRLAAGLTQEQLAERWNSSAVTVSRIENGRMNPGVWGMPSLARVLGCSLTALFEGAAADGRGAHDS
ncbi:MAG: helix-turn-helix transcriptional regulator [Actinomyces succiniciruminis]|nr:helix-turn-helix transcriptional regulator [Actinomyces succiniciruminis]